MFNAFQKRGDVTDFDDRASVADEPGWIARDEFHQTAKNLADVHTLNTSLDGNVKDANALLASIANLNQQIVGSEVGATDQQRPPRDLREQKTEELAKLVDFQSSDGTNGAVNITVGGTCN